MSNIVSEITDEHFAAVGRLTVTFNELDSLLETWLPCLLEIQESQIAEFISVDQPFSQKLSMLKKIVKVWAVSYPVLETPASFLIDLLGRAKTFATARNQLIHSNEGFIFEKNSGPAVTFSRKGLFHKRELVAEHPEQILKTVGEIDHLKMELARHLFKFADALEECTGRGLRTPFKFEKD